MHGVMNKHVNIHGLEFDVFVTLDKRPIPPTHVIRAIQQLHPTWLVEHNNQQTCPGIALE